MTKALSHKGPCRTEKRNGDEQNVDEETKEVVKVVFPRMEQFNRPVVSNKSPTAVSASTNTPISDAEDGRPKKFHRLTTVNPRKVLLLLLFVCVCCWQSSLLPPH